MRKHDGGPTFPVLTGDLSPDATTGLTLRDHFASQALVALVGLSPRGAEQLGNPNGRAYGAWMASEAYALADAMLKERERGS